MDVISIMDNVDSLLHSIFTHRSASERGQSPTESTIILPSILEQNRLERAEIEALQLVNGALNSVNKCNLPFSE